MKFILTSIVLILTVSANLLAQREPLNQWKTFANSSRLMFNGGCQSLPSCIKNVPEDWQEKYRAALPEEVKKAVEEFPAYTKIRAKLRDIQSRLGFEDFEYLDQPFRVSSRWIFKREGEKINGAEKGKPVPLYYNHDGFTAHGYGEKRVDATLPYAVVEDFFELQFDGEFVLATQVKPHFTALKSVLLKNQFDQLIAVGAKYDGVNAFLDNWILFELDVNEKQRKAFWKIYNEAIPEVKEWKADWDKQIERYQDSDSKFEDYGKLTVLRRKIRTKQFALEAKLRDVLTEEQNKKYRRWLSSRVHLEEVDAAVNGQKLLINRSKPLLELPPLPSQ